jgi:hypothetical protein
MFQQLLSNEIFPHILNEDNILYLKVLQDIIRMFLMVVSVEREALKYTGTKIPQYTHERANSSMSVKC